MGLANPTSLINVLWNCKQIFCLETEALDLLVKVLLM
jgi:hypothetical protein